MGQTITGAITGATTHPTITQAATRAAVTRTAVTRTAVLVHEAQSRSLLGSIGHGIVVIILVIFFIGLAIGLVIGFFVGRLSRRR